MELTSKLQNTAKGLVNKQNSDNKCFQWCHIRCLNSQDVRAKKMEDELSRDKLLKKDVEGIISSITPYLPYIGLLSEGLTVGKHRRS